MASVLIHKCKLYSGSPYVAEHDGKYHVMQGSMQKADIKEWYDTTKEAVERWNNRFKGSAICGKTVRVNII
ncbi:MAG: hypothetical protein K2N73_10280 [Lachnospiraceae bacterium]|nr:hypothetical protein [Lachnospiraceae bacterium]